MYIVHSLTAMSHTFKLELDMHLHKWILHTKKRSYNIHRNNFDRDIEFSKRKRRREEVTERESDKKGERKGK